MKHHDRGQCLRAKLGAWQGLRLSPQLLSDKAEMVELGHGRAWNSLPRGARYDGQEPIPSRELEPATSGRRVHLLCLHLPFSKRG